jgi:hypothetical protein
MTSEISFQLMAVNGTVQLFSGDVFSTLVEVIGTDLPVNSLLLLNGKVLNCHMTLQHEGITNGSVVYLITKAPATRRRRCRLTKRCQDEWMYEREVVEIEHEEAKDLESARITDLIWSGWEMSRGHNRMCAMMRQRQLPKPTPIPESEPLNLNTATEISVEPLPTWFAPNEAK